MPDTGKWLRPLVAAGICTAGMAVLVAGIALALGTAGHDWYWSANSRGARFLLDTQDADGGWPGYFSGQRCWTTCSIGSISRCTHWVSTSGDGGTGRI